ncbi:hypothetical protein BPC006_I0451 [Burkholderia pseudomallei BPC006]|nr:hypothetical protein BPC006_I0451 [Burkholderia pseudomallei BPC006]
MRKPQPSLRFFYARGARGDVRPLRGSLRADRARRVRTGEHPSGRGSCARGYTVTAIAPNCSFDSG